MHKIAWTDCTWNPYWGCHNDCSFCYAEKIAKRFAKQTAAIELKYRNENNIIIEDQNDLLRWRLDNFLPTPLFHRFNKIPKNPCKVFVDSMSDIAFWENDDLRNIIKIIEKYPKHIFQILTKSPDLLKEKINFIKLTLPDNVWLGYSIATNNDLIDAIYLGIIDKFAKIPASIHFLSLEPLIINKKNNSFNFLGIDWVIIGGCTGVKDKAINYKLANEIITYCTEKDIPIYFKSWGDYIPADQLLHYDTITRSKIVRKKRVEIDGQLFYKAGAKLSGNIFNGIIYQQFPNV